MLFHTTYSEYFTENLRLLDALDFLAELPQHIPPAGVELIRRYGLYSSRSKGHCTRMPNVGQHAPALAAHPCCGNHRRSRPALAT